MDTTAGAPVSCTFQVTQGDALGATRGLVFIKSTASPALTLSHNYTVTLKGGAGANVVKDLAGNKLAADYSWDFTVEDTTDTAAPAYNAGASMPADGATGVDPNGDILLSFDDDVYNNTVMNAIELGGRVQMKTGATNITGIAIGIGTMVLILPDSPLSANTTYTVTFKGTGPDKITDDMGNTLAGDVTVTWTTAP